MANARFPRKVAWVSCAGGVRAGGRPVPEEGDCQALAETGGASLLCGFGCLGLGSCVRSCKLGALRINRFGVAEVDAEKCRNCGRCLKACPRGLIHVRLYDAPMVAACANRDPGAAARKACSVSCIACRLCEKNCPCDAIVVRDNLAAIDDDACLGCGRCVTRCPRKCIVDVRGVILAQLSDPHHLNA